jgi:hypothetical protein
MMDIHSICKGCYGKLSRNMKPNPFLAPFENFVMRSINFSSLLPFLVLAFALKTRSLFGSISSLLVMFSNPTQYRVWNVSKVGAW